MKRISVFLGFVFLLAACSKLDVKQGPFSVTLKGETGDTEAYIAVKPRPANFSSEKERIGNGETRELALYYDVPEITVFGPGGTPDNSDKIWNKYKIMPGGFNYTIQTSENRDCVIKSELDAAEFGLGEIIYLHEASSLFGDFKDGNSKTTVKIANLSGLTYTLENGSANGAQIIASSAQLKAKIYTLAPSFYFSSDDKGEQKITTLANGLPIFVHISPDPRTANNIVAFTVTLSHQQ